MVKSKFRSFIYLVAFILPLITAAGLSAQALEFSITEWDTGPLPRDIVVRQAVSVQNNTAAPVAIELVSTCGCMTTEPETLTAGPGETGEFTIYFDSSDDEGQFEKLLIIFTDSPEMPKGLFIVSGSVDVPGTGDSLADAAGAAAAAVSAEGSFPRYYYTPGCKSCNRFLSRAEISIDKRDITEPVYYEELIELLASRGVALRVIPVFITEDAVFQGEDDIKEAYNAIVNGGSPPDSELPDSALPQGGAGTAGGIIIGILPILAAGLLDGVNPCAFTTIIFLLSALSVAGRSRRETFIIGLFFTAAVFASYYLIGLGFFKIIRIADSFSVISLVIRWLLFGVLILFAALSFYDYTKIRAGKSSEILLQLPDSVKKKMHGSIRAYSKSAALAGSAVVMGVLISIFELGCTGQIYFPTITYIIQTDEAASGYLYLALYNLAFILPLAAVFIVVYFGITSKKITRVFQDKLGLIKILTGVLFLCFAALMLLL